MDEGIPAADGQPGCRELRDISVVTVRHGPGDLSARNAAQAQRLTWPDTPGIFATDDPCMVWRSPNEVIALGRRREPLDSLLQLLAPGHHPAAMAACVSEAFALFELHGPGLDLWLAHLVDAAAIPRHAGQATRCRLADAAVMLLRFEARRLWLVAERPVARYVQAWLAYAHQGTFAVPHVARPP